MPQANYLPLPQQNTLYHGPCLVCQVIVTTPKPQPYQTPKHGPHTMCDVHLGEVIERYRKLGGTPTSPVELVEQAIDDVIAGWEGMKPSKLQPQKDEEIYDLSGAYGEG